MQVQAETGAELEREWHSKLQYYQSKYPQEAAEFESLLDGGMVLGWEDSLPVMSRHLCWKFWHNFLQWMSSEIAFKTVVNLILLKTMLLFYQ